MSVEAGQQQCASAPSVAGKASIRVGAALGAALCLLASFCVSATAGPPEGTAVQTASTADASRTWRVWLEPKFLRAAVTQPIPGAAQTEFAAGHLEGGEALYFLKAQFADLKIEWPKFFDRARQNAEPELRELKPVYSRDRRNVIEYATVSSDHPVLARAVLAPGFLALFRSTLGEKVLVAVPNRYTAYVFPHLASNYREFAPLVLEAYRATAYPVSLEVFELGASGLRAVGKYEEP